jgi:hypothetical protein
MTKEELLLLYNVALHSLADVRQREKALKLITRELNLKEIDPRKAKLEEENNLSKDKLSSQ